MHLRTPCHIGEIRLWLRTKATGARCGLALDQEGFAHPSSILRQTYLYFRAKKPNKPCTNAIYLREASDSSERNAHTDKYYYAYAS